jgi:hypothetical protein
MQRLTGFVDASRCLRILLSIAVALLAPMVCSATAQVGMAHTLSATVLPAPARTQGSQLAVSWTGAAGAHLYATLQRSAQADLPLVAGHRLDSGVNLLPLPLDADAYGQLKLEARDAVGTVLAVWTRDVGKSRGDSDFVWESAFVGPGFDEGASVGMGGARDMVVWDDGNGPALYVGGGFLTAGAQQVNRIARWDGAAWTPLTGPLGTGIGMDGGGNPSVKALAVFDGDLVVAGYFDNAGGVRANNIARWNGSEWLAFDAGLTGVIGVESLAVYNGALIAGGSFTESGGTTVNRVARWSGSQWLPLGSGISGAEFSQTPHVFALAVFDGELIVGGNFIDAGGVTVSRIARWNGSSWAALGAGVSEAAVPSSTLPSVNALAVMDDTLIVGGNFRRAGSVAAGAVARWDGSNWTALGSGMTGTGNVRVQALAVFGSELMAGGSFANADGVSVNHVARWNGSQWSALQGPTGVGVTSAVETLVVFGSHVIAAGYEFQEAGGVVVNGIARWSGSAWSTLDGETGTGVLGEINATTIYNGDLVIAGSFGRAGGETVHAVARWDGSTWQALDGPFAPGISSPPGAGVSPSASALAVFNGELIVGGRFLDAGGVFVNHIARWDGSRWWPLGPDGSGVDGGSVPAVSALTVHNGALIVAGRFTTAGGTGANNIARWDGSIWSALGNGTDDEVSALTVFGGELIAGGNFNQAGGQAASGIARWNGTAWSALGSGMNGGVLALTPYDGALIAAGNFSQAGGQTVNRIARWNGSNWGALTGASGSGVDGQALALAVYAGELFVGGRFQNAGGFPVNYIARWNGSDWLPLVGIGGAGVGGWSGAVVRALAVADLDGAGPEPEKLIAAGRFHLTGGVANWNVGVYGPGDPLSLLDVVPGIADFGTVIVGWTTDPQTVTLSSIGSASVSVSAIADAIAPFHRSGGSCPAAPFDLPPLAACTLEYEFEPTAHGNFAQGIAIEAVVDGVPAAFNLSGAGLIEARPPIAHVAPDHLAATVAVDGSASATLTIGNAGDQTLDWLVTSAAAVSPSGFGDNIRAMAVWDDGHGPVLYVAGDRGSAFSGIARWDGRVWSWLGAGMNGVVDSLAVYDGALIAGGTFTQAGGVTVNRVARWDGTEWTALDMGLTGTSSARVNALAVYDGALIAGGSFTKAGTLAVNGIARWDGSQWSALATGLSTQVFALTVHDGGLIAAGGFTTVGGQTFNRIARWDGSNWSPLGSGIASSVLALGVHDGALIAGGGFTSAGGAPANRIARWDGSNWSPLGAGVSNQVGTLLSFDGGLIAAGIFTEAGGVPVNRIARWDGSSWSALAGGVSHRASALMVFDGTLIVGGQFTDAGGLAVDHVARWNGSDWSALTPADPVVCALPDWIDAEPTQGSVAGNDSQSMAVTLDAAGLSAGEYTANLCIDSNDASLLPAIVPVSLSVGGDPPGSDVLVGADSLANDWFGRAVAIDGDTVLVGADAVDVGDNDNQGAAYVFVRDGDGWVQQARLTADDGAQFDQFGITVALSGDTALIGGGHGVNAAYVFTRDGSTWSQQAKLTASDGAADDVFGIAVALSGDTALIGARQAVVAGHMNQGAAYVFVRSGDTWNEQARLTASNGVAFDLFGDAVALSGDTAVIGAAFADPGGNDAQGAAYVFARSGSAWNEQAILGASDAAAGARFGGAVAVSGDTALVGAGFATVGGNANQGAAYVFQRSGTSWSEQARLTAAAGAAGDWFGNAVSVDGDTAVIGAWFTEGRGAAHVYRRSGGSWSESTTLTVAEGSANDQFGNAVAIAGDTAVVGAWLTDVNGRVDQGTAHVFTVEGGSGAAQLEIHPGSIDFGSVPAGITAGPAPFTLVSTGSAPVSVSAISAAVAPFVHVGGDCPALPFELAPGASCALLYSFSPTQVGPASQTFSVTSNAGAHSFVIEGNGIPGIPTVLALIGGDGQSTTVGMPFALPLTVQVRDDFGNPVPGIGVMFEAPASGPGAVLSATSVQTDAGGNASVEASANAEAGNYTVIASGGLGAPVAFALTNLALVADIGIDISVDHEYVQSGQVLNYLVTLHNAGPASADAAAVASTLSPLLDVAAASWICVGPVESGCTPSGQGALVDSGLQLPAGGSVSYLLSAPVRMDAGDGVVETSVDASLAIDPDGSDNNASVASRIVIFRDGFEAAAPAGDAPQAQAGSFDAGAVVVMPWPVPGAAMIEPLLAADAECGDSASCAVASAGFRLERLNAGRSSRVRLVTVDAAGGERSGAWISVGSASDLLLSLVPASDGEQANVLLLLAAGSESALPVATARWRLRSAMPVERHALEE